MKDYIINNDRSISYLTKEDYKKQKKGYPGLVSGIIEGFQEPQYTLIKRKQDTSKALQDIFKPTYLNIFGKDR